MEFILYFIATIKHNQLCGLVAGPFINEELAAFAKAELDTTNPISGSCERKIIEMEMTGTPRGFS